MAGETIETVGLTSVTVADDFEPIGNQLVTGVKRTVRTNVTQMYSRVDQRIATKVLGTATGGVNLIGEEAGALKRFNAQDFIDLSTADNVVIVKQESDFGVAVGDEITLQAETIYQVAVSPLILTKRLVIPERADVSITGGTGFGMSKVIFLGSGVLFSCTDLATFSVSNLRLIDGLGANQLFSLQSGPTFSEESFLNIFKTTCVGWASLGLNKNLAITTAHDIIFLQCGTWTFDNLFAFSFSNFLFQNFAPTNGAQINVITNINQANVNAAAFIPAKNQSPWNIDPAITPTSGIALGTAVPYQGNVFGGVVKYENAGGGNTKVITNGGISFDNGDLIIIINSVNYNGVYAVSNVVKFQLGPSPYTSTGSFTIVKAFVADDGFGLAVLLDGAAPAVVPFFKQGVTGNITAYATNGAGGTTVTSTAHGLSNGQTLYISGDNQNNYDGGYSIFNVTSNTFDIPKPFVANDAKGVWNTGSLNQTNNVVTTLGTGGILPDSQVLGNNILTSTVAFSATTLLTRVQSGVWVSDETERFKATSNGRLIYTGKTSATVSISCRLSCQKQGGSTDTAFMNIMIKVPGAPSFVPVATHPASQTQIQSANPSQLTITAFVDNILPFTEIAVGFSVGTPATINIFSIDLNIKK